MPSKTTQRKKRSTSTQDLERAGGSHAELNPNNRKPSSF
jgi:hypothetical protein